MARACEPAVGAWAAADPAERLGALPIGRVRFDLEPAHWFAKPDRAPSP